MMNEKIQAILLKTVLELKKIGWTASPDWEITLKSEGHVPLVKNIGVENSIGDEEIEESIETHIDVKLDSEDEITYFPNLSIYANILVQGGSTKDVVYSIDVDVALTDQDIQNQMKISMASRKIDSLTNNHLEQEFNEYIDMNTEAIIAYRQGGWKVDQDLER